MDPALLGEVGWPIRLWSLIELEALHARAILSTFPPEAESRRIMEHCLNVPTTWAAATQAILTKRKLPLFEADAESSDSQGDADSAGTQTKRRASRRALHSYRAEIAEELLDQDVVAWQAAVADFTHPHRYAPLQPLPSPQDTLLLESGMGAPAPSAKAPTKGRNMPLHIVLLMSSRGQPGARSGKQS